MHPELAARIEEAIRLSPEDAARALLDLAEEQLGAHPDFPHARRGRHPESPRLELAHRISSLGQLR